MKFKVKLLLLALVFTQASFVSAEIQSIRNEPNKNKTIQIDKTDKMIEVLKYIEQNLIVLYEILQTNRVLAVKAANGIYTWPQRESFDKSFQEMFKEAARTIRRAKYKKYPLLNYTNPGWVPYIVLKLDKTDEPLVYKLPKINPENFGYETWSKNVKIGEPNIKTSMWSNSAFGDIDVAMTELESELTLLGTVIRRIQIAKRVDRKVE